jgi:putative membrane protein
MFTDQMGSVLTGLAFIIPAILLLRWILSRTAGSPDDVAAHHATKLKQRYERGEIDQETYERLHKDLTES